VRCVAAIPAVSLLTGSALGLLLADPPTAVVLVALIVCVTVAVWSFVSERPRALVSCVVAAFVAGGVELSAVAWQRAWRPPLRVAFEGIARVERQRAAAEGRRLPEDDEAFAIVEGILRADASPTTNGISLSVAVETIVGHEGQEGQEGREGQVGRVRASGGILVTVVGALAADRMEEWRAGRRVRMPVTLHRPSRYLDPGVPDHERELARHGTTLVGTVKSGALVDVIAGGSRWSELLAAVRGFSRRAIADAVGRWSPQAAGIVAAIVIGDRSTLDDEVQRRLQEAGTYHVIAISGGNIAILAGVLLGAFRIAGWFGRAAAMAAIATLITYSQIVGGGASVDRATLMAVVYLAARTFDQRSPPLNALAVAAAILVAADPLAIVDPAFLLTFGATFAIVVIVPALDFSLLRRPTAWLAAMFIASVAVELILLPIAAAFFSRVTVAGLALNFLAIPLMGVAQIAGMVAVPIAFVSGSAAAAIGLVAHAGAAGLIWSADLVRFVPAATWRVAPPWWGTCAVYYSAFAIAWVGWRRSVREGSLESSVNRRARRSASVVASIAALWIALDPSVVVTARGDGRLHATFIDVGQGDAIFVVFPRGSTLLVDAGGLGFASSFDIGDRVVAPVIRAAGFRRIDRLALTHGDPDHVGGALAILREFRPREVWEGIPVPRSEALTRLRVEAQASGARWASVHAGDRIEIDGVEVTARHPPREDWERQKVRNDDSLVLDLRWRDVSIVLTGDIGRTTERTLLALPAAPLRILKVPHHGSSTSSSQEFVAALRPRIAVVSAGRNNHFGHPVAEVLGRYLAIGAEIFRTDRDGAVTVESDGRVVSIRTHIGGQRMWLASPVHHEGTKDTKDTKS